MAQTPLDKINSLKEDLAVSTSDSLSLILMSDLCWYYRVVDMDSAFYYGEKQLQLAKKSSSLVGEAQAYNDIGILFFRKSNYKEAIKNYDASLALRKSLQDSLGIAAIYSKMGLLYQTKFEMDSAIFYDTKALKIYNEIGNLRNAIILKNNMANIYKSLKQYDKSLATHLEIEKELNKTDEFLLLTRSYNNIANTYVFLNDSLAAIRYYEKGIALGEKNDFKNELAALYNNLGGIYMAQENYKDAVVNFERTLKIREKSGDIKGLGSVAINLGSAYLETGKKQLAEIYLRKGLEYSKKAEAKEFIMNSYDMMNTFYAHEKNTDSMLHYKALYKNISDSIFSSRITTEISEIETKYQTELKEKEILEQRALIAEKENEVNRKNNIIYGSLGLAVILGLLGYLFYNQQRLKNRQLKKESELKQALVKIETQNKLQEQRLRISRDLHDNIGSQLTFIISSLDNLKFGFPEMKETLSHKLGGISQFTSQTIYELRDTIWAMNKEEISFEDLQVRIANFVEKAKGVSKTSVDFEVDSGISKSSNLSSVVGMNVYRIIQEAVNNAIKYADASGIVIHISEAKNVFKVMIKDDGAGYDENEVEMGNGLNNIKKRARDIHGEILFTSEIGQGTTIDLQFPK